MSGKKPLLSSVRSSFAMPSSISRSRGCTPNRSLSSTTNSISAINLHMTTRGATSTDYDHILISYQLYIERPSLTISKWPFHASRKPSFGVIYFPTSKVLSFWNYDYYKYFSIILFYESINISLQQNSSLPITTKKLDTAREIINTDQTDHQHPNPQPHTQPL